MKLLNGEKKCPSTKKNRHGCNWHTKSITGCCRKGPSKSNKKKHTNQRNQSGLKNGFGGPSGQKPRTHKNASNKIEKGGTHKKFVWGAIARRGKQILRAKDQGEQNSRRDFWEGKT